MTLETELNSYYHTVPFLFASIKPSMTGVLQWEDFVMCDSLLPRCQQRCPNTQAASQSYIANIIRQASMTCVGNDSKRFVSRKVLVERLDTRMVSSLLERCLDQDVDHGLGQDTETIASYISPKIGSRCHCSHKRCTGARILFVVLSLISREDCIEYFVREKICDSALPLSIDETDGTFRLKSREALPSLPEEINAWTPEQQRLFCHFQWAMLSPYFENTPLPDIKTLELDKEVYLPWSESKPLPMPLDDEVSEVANNPPSTIIKIIKINGHYHDFVSPENPPARL